LFSAVIYAVFSAVIMNVDIGQWHFVAYLHHSQKHKCGNNHKSWFDFWAKVTGKEKNDEVACPHCNKTIKLTQEDKEHFDADSFNGHHVLIARGSKDLNAWTYEEKVAIVPGCSGHSRDPLNVGHIEAAVIPPLFGDIPREAPVPGLNGSRSELPKRKADWKTLAVVSCTHNAEADSYRLRLRGTDCAGYTWDDEVPQGDKSFGDFKVDVKEKDFMFKYLTPMIWLFNDPKPKDVRRGISYNPTDVPNTDVPKLIPWRLLNHRSLASPI